MTTWEQYYRDQENEAFGQFLIETIAKDIGCDPDPRLIDKYVFKGTSCGAWCRFDEQGIMVGTIVEGSDAEFSTRISLDGIDADDEGAAELSRRFWAALKECENFSDEVWAMEEQDGDQA